MTTRPHRDRLLHDLDEVRKELAGEVQRIKPEELVWEPRPGMRTLKGLLLEIGATEKLCMHWLSHQAMYDWKQAEAEIGADESDPGRILAGLQRVREATLGYLNSCNEETLQTPIAVPKEWQGYMGPAIEPEEVVRWVARHEYYHLGQLISYRWLLGDNPYRRETNPD